MRIIYFFFLFTASTFAQNNNQKLAYQYYINGDYDKAIIIYDELNTSRLAINTYSPYFISLCNVDKFPEAEKLAKKFYTKYPDRLNYLADIIISQFKRGYIKKSDYNLKRLYKKMTGQNSQTIQIANRFQSFNMYNQALEIYNRSQLINSNFQYDLQKAQLYAFLGEDKLMIDQYLDFLLRMPNQKKIVFTTIQRFLYNNGIKNENNYLLVKKSLLKMIKLYPKRVDFNEILIWFFMQDKKYKLALSQVISLDRRTNNALTNIYEIGETLLDLGKYKLAIEAFEYIIERGFNSNIYIDAQINRLYALTKSIEDKSKDVKIIDNKYSEVIAEVGVHRFSVLLLSNHAHFKAFFLNDLKSATKILEEVMKIKLIDRLDLAECKIQYADVMLLSGNIWDALLFYSQVENDFKQHPIGHKAKFKRAEIAYFQGDFTWAQAQLDVLKSSTSKLISNDAMKLSLLITDNYDLDTIDIPMMQFARADLLSFQKKYEVALLSYDSILDNFKGHDLSDEIYYRKANIYLANNDLDNYIEMLELIVKEYSYDILIDDALFDLAKIYDYKLNNDEKAREYYQQLILNYQGSIFVSEARERFRILRGDNLINN
ncbi:MAG: tetratricopeptide repeat protein [Flavobacteriales bacterium]|jgi:tetratricopeptide (TPR) repeat protein|nr:tetratricopeptide repeat protein [Flavobacteriales bacterium]